MVRVKVFLFFVMLSFSSFAHGPITAHYDEYGMFLVNETNHYHYCQIGRYHFGLPSGARSYSYPPAAWRCQ